MSLGFSLSLRLGGVLPEVLGLCELPTQGAKGSKLPVFRSDNVGLEEKSVTVSEEKTSRWEDKLTFVGIGLELIGNAFSWLTFFKALNSSLAESFGIPANPFLVFFPFLGWRTIPLIYFFRRSTFIWKVSSDRSVLLWSTAIPMLIAAFLLIPQAESSSKVKPLPRRTFML
ncbi:hypothetical protein HWI79_1576 [Cryptosporidium felis]|nr:hypothetical protein HWI79_1576 [Cryptosporidium felis]